MVSQVPALKPSPETDLLQGAVRLSAHVLAVDVAQFASQMVGRLLPHQDSPKIRRFTGEVATAAQVVWLKPLQSTLNPAGSCLVRTLEGHSNWVNGVAMSADGHRAVSASHDDTLMVWDLETGRALRTLKGHTKWVNAVAVCTDWRHAVRFIGQNAEGVGSGDWTSPVHAGRPLERCQWRGDDYGRAACGLRIKRRNTESVGSGDR
jgi:WD40 repeat protein